MAQFLPISKQDMKDRGIEQLDFVYVCGDAYVDHPSFGAAIICRILELHGYTVGIIAQPDWKDDNSINILGEPRLGFFVSAGNMDSMVNHYSVSKHRRDYDNYSPGGKIGLRPDYATVVYCNLIRHTYKKKPIIIGGIEASLRRLAHYDYWSNKVRRSILLDSGADLISYGMGERSVVEIADCLASGMDVKDITYIDGTVFKTRDKSFTEDAIILPSYEDIKADKATYAKSFYTQYVNTDAFTAKKLVETYDGAMYVIQNPPQKPLTRQEMDDVYAIEYMRTYHPIYEKDGGIPAIKEVKFSLISNRGCFGGCNFCALTFHQGRIIQSRSHESIINEAKLITQDPEFKGYIHDVGGPTANFRNPSCKKQMEKGVCMHRQCLFPTKCPNLEVDHKDYVSLLTKLRKLPKVKKVFVRSGVRFDYVMYDKDDTFLRDLCKYHVSGQLKVAPEHISNNVLSYLGKPDISVYNSFCDKYAKINKEIGLKQYLVPYLMSSHPGSTLDDAIALAEYLRDHHLSPEQVQDFYPTPSTISTTMYYTEIDPRDMKPVYICKNPHEKAMQRALIQYKRPENYDLVKEALIKAGREDLIGFGEECLIPPRKIKGKEFKKNDSKKSDSKKNNDSKKSNSIKNNKNTKKQPSGKQNKTNERTKNRRKR
ncbi:MAG: YgiQ family radical SAM protein [Pseudobutyrivibrio ruminis]|uniref:YgiQ family radical SAM protein n=1 Tax=Pseudobutyrivibrio ruminis TaxID=46206 RepID=UPI0026EE7003|nr:YgiQ family radical SAM protein [Pseudobutyrivibrio ruminis]MBE5912456.1 YgiQ family radical SAM protein [Pseudobutyrivibrio ruminis]